MSPQFRRRGSAIAAAAILLIPAFGQSSSTTTGGSSTPSTGTPTKSPGALTIPSVGTTPSTTPTTQPPVTQPIRISGRVMVDDGTAPSFPAVIERVCSGSPHAEGYTDSSGYFSITLGQSTDVIADASETPGFNRTAGTLGSMG